MAITEYEPHPQTGRTEDLNPWIGAPRFAVVETATCEHCGRDLQRRLSWSTHPEATPPTGPDDPRLVEGQRGWAHADTGEAHCHRPPLATPVAGTIHAQDRTLVYNVIRAQIEHVPFERLRPVGALPDNPNALFTAARTLNNGGDYHQDELTLYFISGHPTDGASGTQHAEASEAGEKALLEFAARVVANGGAASVKYPGGLIGDLTAEVLTCDCGKGFDCPLIKPKSPTAT